MPPLNLPAGSRLVNISLVARCSPRGKADVRDPAKVEAPSELDGADNHDLEDVGDVPEVRVAPARVVPRDQPARALRDEPARVIGDGRSSDLGIAGADGMDPARITDATVSDTRGASRDFEDSMTESTDAVVLFTGALAGATIFGTATGVDVAAFVVCVTAAFAADCTG
jgi:hypothetical protein